METRANFVLIGLFTLAVIASAFGFVYWFQNLGTASERTTYRVVFDGPVSGLRTGAGVTFNGIRVGEVASVSVGNPREVVAGLSIDRTAPIRRDTQVGLEFQGLTGIAAVALRGGSVDAPAVQPGPDGIPTLRAAGSSLDVTEAVRSTLNRVDQVIIDNQEALKTAIKSIDTFTAALARNSDSAENILKSIDSFTTALARNSARVDNIMIGLEKLSGTKDKDGELLLTVQSIRELAENLDKRTAEITTSVNRFMSAGVGLVSTGRRTLGDISRTVNNFDRNPSRVLFGASNSDAPAPPSPQQQQRQQQKQQPQPFLFGNPR